MVDEAIGVSIAGLVPALVSALITAYLVDTTSDCPLKTVPAIGYAWKLVLFAALGGLVLIWFVRKLRPVLVAFLLVEATALGTGAVLVAADGGTYVGIHLDCGLQGRQTFTEVHHVSLLYLFWGVPFAVFVLEAVRVWRFEVEQADSVS